MSYLNIKTNLYSFYQMQKLVDQNESKTKQSSLSGPCMVHRNQH